jgi:hypothetical protein
MAKANMVLPDGTTVAIEGTPEEVAALIERFAAAESSPARPRRSASSKRKPESTATRTQPRGAIAYIRELINEDFFREQQGLSEVRAALAARALIYPVTTISPAMFRLVRRRELKRIQDMEDGQWKYVNP